MTTLSSPERANGPAAEALPAEPILDNPLSEREMEVARLLARGQSNAEIARELVISPHTVKVHLRNIFEKLQVNSRTEASMMLVQHGWIIVPGVDIPLPMEGSERLTEPAAPPEPEPLADVAPSLAPWQRIYLAAVLLLGLIALVVPNLRARAPAIPELLSDAGRTVVGKPVVVFQPRWDPRTPLNVARDRLAAVRVREHLYVMGGETANGQMVASVEAYDLNINEWRSRSPLPEPLANLTAAALSETIYVAGGSTASGGAITVRDLFLRYQPALNRWESVGVLPNPVAGAQLVSDDEALYLLGGWDGQATRNEVWRYLPDAEGGRANWELMTRMPAALAFFGATLVADEIYVVGGYDGQRESNQAHAFTLSSGVWRELPQLSEPRSGLSLVYDGLAIFALGGGWTRPLDTLERFDPSVGTWSNFPSPLPGEWRHMGAVGYNDRLYLIGGWSGDYLDVHLQYQSTFRALLPVISSD
jgi:DNA-binding CsgD family transcriptional regulator